MACFALALTSCGGSDNGGKEEPPVPPVTGDGIPGCWKLTSWQPATNFNKEVYIQFVVSGSDDNVGTFVLYQNVSSVGMEKLEGSYRYDANTQVMTGSYTGDIAWTYPSYTISGDLKSTMVWTAVDNTTDVSTYTRIEKIPDDVVNETRATVASSGIRYL